MYKTKLGDNKDWAIKYTLSLSWGTTRAASLKQEIQPAMWDYVTVISKLESEE